MSETPAKITHGTVYIIDAGTYLRAYAIPEVMGDDQHPEDTPKEARKDWALVALLNRDGSLALLDSRFKHEKEFFEMGCAGAYFGATWNEDGSPMAHRMERVEQKPLDRLSDSLKNLMSRKKEPDVSITFLTPH